MQSRVNVAALRPFVLSSIDLFQLTLEILDLFLQRDHLEFTTNYHFFKLFQVQDFFLQLGLRFLQVAHYLLISTHVTQDANGANDSPVRITQGRGIECRRDNFARGAARIEAGIACHSSLDNFAQGSKEFTGFFGTDEARERLLQHLVWTKTQQLVDGIVRLQNLAFQVRDKHRVRRVLDQAI